EAGRPVCVRSCIGWVIPVPEAVRRSTGVRDVRRVRLTLAGVVVQTARDFASACGHEVREARTLVIVPRFRSELEVGDVLLRQNLSEECLTSHDLGGQTVIRTLLVQLRERGGLVAGAISSLGPDQSVLIISHVRLLEIRSEPLVTYVVARRGGLEILGPA